MNFLILLCESAQNSTETEIFPVFHLKNKCKVFQRQTNILNNSCITVPTWIVHNKLRSWNGLAHFVSRWKGFADNNKGDRNFAVVYFKFSKATNKTSLKPWKVSYFRTYGVYNENFENFTIFEYAKFKWRDREII